MSDQKSGSANQGEYIRQHYGVPAHVGERICFCKRALGTIVGFDHQYLLVQMDEADADSRPGRLHPTWEVEYLPPRCKALDPHGRVRCTREKDHDGRRHFYDPMNDEEDLVIWLLGQEGDEPVMPRA